MTLEKAQAKIEKFQAKLKAAREEVAKQKAMAAARATSKTRQCADIAFRLLLDKRPDVIEWVEANLERDKDKVTFLEWRETSSDGNNGTTAAMGQATDGLTAT